MSEWISWDGSDDSTPPCGPDRLIKVKIRDGEEWPIAVCAGKVDWKNRGKPDDIVAYRFTDNPYETA